jgi:hypothetical protein
MMRAARRTAVFCAVLTFAAGAALAQTNVPRRTPQQVTPTGEEDAATMTPEDERGRRMLEAFTNHSTEGLTFEQRPDGTLGLDLQGRFQNVLTAAPTKDGGFLLSCRHGAAHAAHRPLAAPWLPVRGRTPGKLNVQPLPSPILVVDKTPVLEEK